MLIAFGYSLGIVAYLALFAVVGALFVLVSLLAGRLVRTQNPEVEKLEVYECGEPAIGSSFVQFDLRFYVVALLFIIFDVEVALFFPWATVFGKATLLMDLRPENVVAERVAGGVELSPQARGLYHELGVRQPSPPLDVPASLADDPSVAQAGDELARVDAVIKRGSRQLALVTLADIGVFFAILMVGFAYVWVRGDLDWVRSVVGQRTEQPTIAEADRADREFTQTISI